MKIPKIEVKVNRNYCLYDFLTRISSLYGPYNNERELYSKKLSKIISNFTIFKSKNLSKDENFFIKNVGKFDNEVFKKLWKEFEPVLKKQYKQVKRIIQKEGASYLKKILKVTKIKRYAYKKIIVFLSFPRIKKIKPRIYSHTGSPSVYKDKCIITLGLIPDREYKNANDLFVLWHELIHTLDLPIEVWQDIDEGITEFYENIIVNKSKKVIKDRLFGIFYEKYPKKLALKMIKTCLNWDLNKKDMLQLKFELAKIYKRYS